MVDQTVEEEVANPYNAKKAWQSDRQEERGLQSADDSLFYKAPTKEVVDEDVTTDAEATLEDQENTGGQDEVNRYTKTDYKKRYDDLKRHYDRKLSEFKTEKQRLLDEAKSARPKYTPPKTPEELATFKEEYSDVYEVAETIAHQRASAMFEELQGKIANLEKQSKMLEHEKATAELRSLHPDFDEISGDPKFHEWAENQPEIIQTWIYKNGTDAKLAARAIDLYKRDTGKSVEKESKPESKPTQPRKPSAADTVAVTSKAEPKANTKKVWTTSEIEGLSVEQFDKYSKEIDEALLEGRIMKG